MKKIGIVATNLRESFNDHRNHLSQIDESLVEDYLSNLHEEDSGEFGLGGDWWEDSSDTARAILNLYAIDENKSRWHTKKPQLSDKTRNKINLALRKTEELLGEKPDDNFTW